MAEPLNLRGYPRGIARTESHGAQPKFAAADDLRFEFPIAEYNPLASFHLASRTHQCFPYVGADLPREEDLHCAAQMLPARGAGGRVGKDSRASAEESSWNDTRIIQNDEFVAAKQARKLSEASIRELATLPIHAQKPRTVAPRQRALGDLRLREEIVEFIEAHGLTV